MKRRAFLLLCFAVLCAPRADAELRALDASASVAIEAAQAGAAPVREQALNEALRHAVRRAARELVPTALADRDDAGLDALLGGDPATFASRYRIVGEGEGADASGQPEYRVALTASVDLDRLRAALAAAGQTVAASAGSARRPAQLVLENLPDHSAYVAFVALLRQQAGVRAVEPLSFERGRVLLGFESERDPSALLEALRASAGPQRAPREARADGDRLIWIFPEAAAPAGAAPPAASVPAGAADPGGPQLTAIIYLTNPRATATIGSFGGTTDGFDEPPLY